jgi:hypothetical protein
MVLVALDVTLLKEEGVLVILHSRLREHGQGEVAEEVPLLGRRLQSAVGEE